MLKLIQMASPKARLTRNCDTKYLESRSPASLSARVADAYVGRAGDADEAVAQ